jgi:hypothetical protein
MARHDIIVPGLARGPSWAMLGLRDKPVGQHEHGTISDDPFSPLVGPFGPKSPARPGPVHLWPITTSPDSRSRDGSVLYWCTVSTVQIPNFQYQAAQPLATVASAQTAQTADAGAQMAHGPKQRLTLNSLTYYCGTAGPPHSAGSQAVVRAPATSGRRPKTLVATSPVGSRQPLRRSLVPLRRKP